MERRIHRWFATTGSIFLVWLTATGLLTAIVQVFAPPPAFHPAPPRPVNTGLSVADIDVGKLQAIIARATEARPVKPRSLHVELAVLKSHYIATVSFDGERDGARFDLRSGSAAVGAPGGAPPPGLGQILVGLHSGAVAGPAGQFFTVCIGLALAGLLVTGLILYFNLLGRMRAAGRTGFLWK